MPHLRKVLQGLKSMGRVGVWLLLIGTCAVVISNSFVFAEIHNALTVQGKVVNTDGTNVADGLYDFIFTLYDGAGSGASTLATESWTSGALFSSTMSSVPAASGESLTYVSDTNESSLQAGQTLWNVTKVESVTVVSVNTGSNTIAISPTRQAWDTTDIITNRIYVKDGIFRVNIGTLTDISSVNFNSASIFVGTNFNNDGEMKPRVQLGASPYAFNAQKVAGLTVTDTTGTLTIPNGQTIAFSGSNDLTYVTLGDTVATLPSGTITLVDLSTLQTLTNKTVGSTGLTFSGAATDITTAPGEGLVLNGNGLSVFRTSSGNITFQPAGVSTTGYIQIGEGGAGSTAPDLLVVDSKSDAGDPAGVNGAMYYNASANTFRCYANGGWQNCGYSGLFVDTSTFIHPLSPTRDFVLGANTIGAASLYFDVSNGELFLGTNESVDGSLTLYSSGVGVTDAKISTNVSGDVQISALSGLVSLTASSLKVEVASVPTSDVVSISNAGFGLTTSSVDGLAIEYVQSSNAASIQGSALDVSITPSTDATDTIRGIRVNAIAGTASTEYGLEIGTGYDLGINVLTVANYFAGLRMGGVLDLDGNEIILDADGDTSVTADTDDQIDFRLNGADELVLTTSALYPATTLGLDLGTSSNYWNALYINGGTIYFDDTNDATFGYNAANDYFTFDANGDATVDAIISADGLSVGNTVNTATFINSPAATSLKSQIHLTSSAGTNVTSPVSGDLWWNGTNLYFFNGTINKDLLNFEEKGNRQTVLTPQYPGAVTQPDGSNNNVIISYGMDTVSNYDLNYIQCRGPNNANDQDTDIYVKWKVPENFNGFQQGTNDALIVDLLTQSTDSTVSRLDVYIRKDGTTATPTSSTNNTSTTANTWNAYALGNQVVTFDDSDTTLSSLSAGDTLVIRLYCLVDRNTNVRIGSITLNWKSN